MSIRFRVEGGQLIISDTRTGKPRFAGLVGGAPVIKACRVGENEGCVVLLDPDASEEGTYENVARVDLTGRILWRAKLSSSPDTFVELGWEDRGLIGTTWSGWRLLIDPETGATSPLEFTK